MLRSWLPVAMIANLCAAHAEVISLPDPTRPARFRVALLEPVTVEEQEQFSLRAIKIGHDRRTAIINGRITTVGDRVGTATVLEIGPAGVVLDYRDQRVELSLLSLQVRRDGPGANECREQKPCLNGSEIAHTD